MKALDIPVKTSERAFFRQIVGLLSSFPPIRGSRPRELDTLGEILYQNYKFKDVSEDVRSVVIFSTENRKEMCSNLNMSEDAFNNNLSILRKNNIILSDNKLEKYMLRMIPESKYVFSVTFNIVKYED